MNDELERKLDEMYRRLDAPARRLDRRWRARRPRTRTRNFAAWIAVGAVSAAALILVLLHRPSTDRPAPVPRREPVALRSEPPPRFKKEEVRPRARPPVPRTDLPARVPDEPPPKREDPPRRDEPKRDRPPEPRSTEAEPAIVTFLEVDGAIDVAGRSIRGKSKDVRVRAGERLTAASATKLVLSERRFLVLAPKSAISFAVEGKAVAARLDHGEVLAELIGPGPEIRVVTGACSVRPLGTVFDVRIEGTRTTIVVEEGSVECSAGGRSVRVRPGQQIAVAPDAPLPAPTPADLRRLAWARGHRAAERRLFAEDFSKPGGWEAAVEGGAAKGIPDPPWCAGKVRLESADPLFAVPVRGRITIVCRTDRPANLVLQIHAREPKLNFMQEFRIARAGAWVTLTAEFDRFVPRDKSRKEALVPGAPVSEIYLQYGEDGEKGAFWVDSIVVTEVRP
ncbi:MAG: FecR domain-containing protein [Planctomycetes bacterium]|nr:FecR domain-containing protein [Planctomycetota bacterium]